jgi:septum formation protein
MIDAGYDFEVMPPSIAEDRLEPEVPRVLAGSLAYAKAREVANRLEEGLIVGADTVVAVGDEIIGKPTDVGDARKILKKLSGTTHEVITGIALVNVRRGERLIGTDVTHIGMKALSDDEIDAYVSSGEGLGKAGAYAIQENGDRFVTSIDGSFTNVVGLPMKLLAGFLDMMSQLIYRDPPHAH